MLTPEEIKKELANALSHGIGILVTIIVSPILITMAMQKANPNLIFAVASYCFTVLLMFTSSTLYHAVSNPLVKKNLRIFDHISIFFLIGGSYAPFVVLFTPPKTAFWFFIVQWILIAMGIVMKLFYTGKFRLLSTIIYIFIGSLVLFLGQYFWTNMPQKSIYLIVAGGLFYLIGTVFYQNQKIPYNHLIWHIFVFFAAFFHFFGVMYAVKL